MTDLPPAHEPSPAGTDGRRTDDADADADGDRRALLDSVAVDVSELRRDVRALSDARRELTGLVGEALPRLGEVEHGLAGLAAQVGALGEQRDARPASPYSDQALTVQGYLPDPGHPVVWSLMDPEQATAAWEALGRWVGEVLCGPHQLTRAQLPDCWALHPPAVIALSWCHQHHRLLIATGTTAGLPEWHTRWLPDALAAVRDAITPDACAPGLFHQLDEQARNDEADLLRSQNRTQDRAPEPGTRASRTPTRSGAFGPDAARPPSFDAARRARRDQLWARTGPDRPRFLGPTDWLRTHDPAGGIRARTDHQQLRDQLAAQRQHPTHWLAPFHDASALDLAARHANNHQHSEHDYRPGTPRPRAVDEPTG